MYNVVEHQHLLNHAKISIALIKILGQTLTQILFDHLSVQHYWQLPSVLLTLMLAAYQEISFSKKKIYIYILKLTLHKYSNQCTQ